MHAQPASPAGNEAFMTSLAPQTMTKPGCLRSLCAVDGLLNSPMSSDNMELCNFAAPLCSEPHSVLDAPLYLSLKARQGHSGPPDCAHRVAALRALLSANHLPMMADCAKAPGRLSCPQRPSVLGRLFGEYITGRGSTRVYTVQLCMYYRTVLQ